MPVTPIANRPPHDATGGYMSVRFKLAGRIVNVARLHVPAFTEDADGSYNAPATTEVSVRATFTALLPFLRALYNTDWDIQLTALTQVVGGTTTRVAVPAASGGGYLGNAGSGSTATSGIEGIVKTILTFNTLASSGKGRLTLMGIGGQDIALDSPIAANSAGTPLEKLVAYIEGSTTAILAHNGDTMVAPCHATYVLASRARRLSMRVA